MTEASRYKYLSNSHIADVLDDAADVIEKHGWNQGHLISDDGTSVCAMGALDYVTDGISLRDGKFICIPSINMSSSYDALLANAAVNALCIQLKRECEDGIDGIATWNDTPGRTKQEVLDMLRKTAKHVRG